VGIVRKIRNPNLEIRNNAENSKSELPLWSFVLVSDFGFRISDLFSEPVS